MKHTSKDEILLVYDRQCPFCENYSQLIRLRDNVAQLTIIDAREASPICEEITKQGLNLDDGMVLKLSGRLYHGADVIHILALLSSRSGLFNKLNYWFFKSEKIALVLYPILKYFRHIVLKLLGRKKIKNLDNN